MSESTPRPTFGSAVVYKDPMAALEWLEKAFGFETTMLITDDNGNLAHSEMNFGDGYIMVGYEWAENMKAPSSVGGANTQRVSVHIDASADQHCERARAAGAIITQEPQDQPYGARTYVCKDLEGHEWNFNEPRPFVPGAMEAGGMHVQQFRDEPAVTTLFPQAFYRDAKAAVIWLGEAFGFEVSLIVENQDGSVRAHLAFQDTEVALGSEWSDDADVRPSHSSPRSVGGANTQSIHVQLKEGIDAHCDRARGAGAVILQEPEDQFYGDRTYRALDPEGHMWSFGQTVKVTTPEEWEAATGLKTRTSL
jgi:uncharacterized glyoxalase superfamily protein PhnB